MWLLSLTSWNNLVEISVSYLRHSIILEMSLRPYIAEVQLLKGQDEPLELEVQNNLDIIYRDKWLKSSNLENSVNR